MAVNVDRTLRVALAKLTSERVRIDRQIAAIESALGRDEGGSRRRGPVQKARPRKRVSAAARKAASRRMKAYWAKRRAEAGKAGGKGRR